MWVHYFWKIGSGIGGSSDGLGRGGGGGVQKEAHLSTQLGRHVSDVNLGKKTMNEK
jgi:hypothetical protein